MNIALTLVLLFSGILVACPLFADGGKPEDGFAKHKPEVLAKLNAEKAAIEQMIGCATAAQKHEDMKKCHEQRQAAMESLHAKDKAMRKQHLQDEIKKIDEEPAKH